ncbi:MAG TPA: SAM hydroxide adenosyltransferase, partial [Acidimicrobiales bacterium]|nr:SAM hydroxide adenosyltransferase [Acidimicrobiales bacterium]
VEAEVTWIDGYGNVELAAGEPHAEAAGIDEFATVEASAGTFSARRVSAYAELGSDELGLLVDSSRFLAIVRNQGSAAQTLHIEPGQVVVLRSARGSE